MIEEELIRNLANKAIEHRLVLFLGAGFSKAVLGGKIALSWSQLLQRVASHFELTDQMPKDDSLPLDYPELASRLCRTLFDKRCVGDATVTYAQCVDAIKRYACRIADWRLLHKDESDEDRKDMDDNAKKSEDKSARLYKAIKSIDPVLIVTTNYDHVIESILEGDCVSLSTRDVLTGVPSSRIPIYHLHGICDDPKNIVLTREDYVEATRPFSYRQSRLTALLRENSVLYVGYGKNDFNILSALDVARHAFGDVDCGVKHCEKELHVQLIYPQKNDYPHQLYKMTEGDARCEGSQNVYPVEMCEHYTSDTIGFLQRISDQIGKMNESNKKCYEEEKAKIDSWSADVPDESDVLKGEVRRREYENLFKHARKLFASRTVVTQKVIMEFCNKIADHYKALKEYSKQPGQFIGYAYCWAFLSSYFQVLDDHSPYSLFSVYSTQFCDAVYLLNGLAKKLNEMNDRRGGTEDDRMPVSHQWLCYDWKHKLASDVKIAILEQAELLAEQCQNENAIEKLIDRAEETIKSWR